MPRHNKPCPECGEFEHGRLVNDICSGCRQKLINYDILIEAIQKNIDAGDLVPVNLATRGFDQPYIASGDDEVRNQFLNLAEAVSVRSWRKTKYGSEYGIFDSKQRRCDHKGSDLLDDRANFGGSRQSAQVLLPPVAAHALEALYAAIQNLSDNQYQAGHSKGRDLLMGLHCGEVTMSDFEEQIELIDERFGG